MPTITLEVSDEIMKIIQTLAERKNMSAENYSAALFKLAILEGAETLGFMHEAVERIKGQIAEEIANQISHEGGQTQ